MGWLRQQCRMGWLRQQCKMQAGCASNAKCKMKLAHLYKLKIAVQQ
jgi:hypothetical protein